MVKIEISESFQVGVIIAKLLGNWKDIERKSYIIRRLLLGIIAEVFSNWRARENDDNSHEGTLKTNAVKKDWTFWQIQQEKAFEELR